MNDKTMPNDVVAEQSVLGAMIISKFAAQKSVENLTEEVFYLDTHAKIFTVIADLMEKGKAIDATTVASELEKRKMLKTIGGASYLSELIDAVPSASNVDEYIAIVNEKAVRRRMIEKAMIIADEARNSSSSLDDFLDASESQILSVVKTRQGTEFKSIQEVLFKTQSDLEKLSQTKGEITGLSTGIYDLDKITSGLQPNSLYIIAGRPSMGKTAFVLNVATHIASTQDKAIAYFSLEMPAEQLALRMLASAGQIDLGKLTRGYLEHNDWKRVNEAMSRLADTNLFIDDTSGITIPEIKAKCRRLASAKEGLCAIIIDHLGLVGTSSKYSGNRQQEVAEISRAFKILAMELKIPVIVAAQLSRGVESREDKRPLLADLRESGAIEQDADVVAFLYRDDYYTRKKEEEATFISESEFIIAKHRNGPQGMIPLIFSRNTQTFSNYMKKESESGVE